MFKVLLFILIGASAQAACINNIAQSEVANAIALVPGVGTKACGAAIKDPCVCFDGIDWRSATLNKDGTLSTDPGKQKVLDAAVVTAQATAATKAKTLQDLQTKAQAGTMSAQDSADAIKLLLMKSGGG